MEKTILEVPIYSMPKKEFDTRWKRKKEQMRQEYMSRGNSAKETERFISQFTIPRSIWKYNQIIGYISITTTGNDIFFNVSCTMDKRFNFNSNKKHLIQNWNINGYHFPVLEKMTNHEIIEKIKENLSNIEKDFLSNKKFYVDYTAFNDIIDYINVREIIDNIE